MKTVTLLWCEDAHYGLGEPPSTGISSELDAIAASLPNVAQFSKVLSKIYTAAV